MAIGATIFLLLSGLGSLYTLLAAGIVARTRCHPKPTAATIEPITLLKPLHGAEPRLAENLLTFLQQDWPAPVQMVAGVQRADDPALAVARPLDVRLVVDDTPHGANGKVANLVNMMPAAAHDLLVLSDSDMSVPPDYLRTIAAALAQPGVGAVTCLYRGRGDAGLWSQLGAAAISYAFLPSVLVGLATGLARPCMGSTIALRRDTLARIGGFARFADVLADDYAIGAAVRELGLTVAVPPMVVTHGCTETSVRALVAHEVRWAATVRSIDPLGHLGMIVTFPVPFALAALAFAPIGGTVALAVALVGRWVLARQVDRFAHACTAPLWVLPVRDCLSLLIFVLSFAAGSVEWRGRRLDMRPAGRIAARSIS